MEQELKREWSQAWSTEIGRNVQRVRKSLGMSAAQVSESCRQLGYSVPRSVIANLESGRKEAVPVHEIVVLAEAMGVPPMHLLYPIDSPSAVQYLPGETASPHEAWSRFSRGLHTADLPVEINDVLRAPEKVEAILTSYGRLTEIERIWKLLSSAVQQLEPSGRRLASREALDDEINALALDALPICKTLDAAGLPWPTLPEGLVVAIHKAERAQRDEEPSRAELEVDVAKTAYPFDAGRI